MNQQPVACGGIKVLGQHGFVYRLADLCTHCKRRADYLNRPNVQRLMPHPQWVEGCPERIDHEEITR